MDALRRRALGGASAEQADLAHGQLDGPVQDVDDERGIRTDGLAVALPADQRAVLVRERLVGVVPVEHVEDNPSDRALGHAVADAIDVVDELGRERALIRYRSEDADGGARENGDAVDPERHRRER